jgi:hypothetical protein
MEDSDRGGDRLDEAQFSSHALKDGRVLLYFHGKLVKTLAGKAAAKFREQVAGLEGREAQLLMAKATGNFKRGSERRG